MDSTDHKKINLLKLKLEVAPPTTSRTGRTIQPSRMIGAIQGGKYSATIAKRLEDLEEEDCRVKRYAKKPMMPIQPSMDQPLRKVASTIKKGK